MAIKTSNHLQPDAFVIGFLLHSLIQNFTTVKTWHFLLISIGLAFILKTLDSWALNDAFNVKLSLNSLWYTALMLLLSYVITKTQNLVLEILAPETLTLRILCFSIAFLITIVIGCTLEAIKNKF